MDIDNEQWVKGLIRSDSLREASTKTGSSPTALAQQLRRKALSPEMVIALCRAYDHPAVEGLVETGYLYPHEVETPGVNLVLPKATNTQLLEEINRRSAPEARQLFTATDDHDVVDIDEDAAVFQFPEKSNTSDTNVTPVWDGEGMPPDAVADSSPEVGGTLDDYDM